MAFKKWNVVNVIELINGVIIELVSRDYDMLAQISAEKSEPTKLGQFTTGTNYYVIPVDDKTCYEIHTTYSELCPEYMQTAPFVPLEQWDTKYGRAFGLPTVVYECLVGIMCTILA
jgi:hypothetical protein